MKGITNQKKILLVIIFIRCYLQTTGLNLQEVNLHKDLFKDYNPNVIPQQNKTIPVEVTLDMFLMSIDKIDEKRQTISIKAFLEIQWYDAFLTWDTTKYTEVPRISVKNTDIWIPDVVLQDTFDKLTDLGQVGGKGNVESNGLVTIWPYNIYTVACKVLVGKFPFDKQKCQFDFLSWSHSTSVLTLKSTQNKPEMKYFTESGEWDLIGSEVDLVRRAYGNDSWDHVYFHFEMQRKSLYQILNVIVPVLCISILNIVSFLLPSESGERVTLSISIFLTLAVFLTTVNSYMPESSDEVASFSVYIGLQLLGSAITIMFTVISLNLFHHEKNIPLPGFLKTLVKICCIKKSKQHYEIGKDIPNENAMACLNETGHGQINDDDEYSFVTWSLLSKSVDKLCLVSAVVWHIVLTVSLLINVTA